MGSNWKNLEKQSTESLDSYEWSTEDSSGGNAGDDKSNRISLSLRDYLNGHDQDVGRSIDCKGHSDEVLNGTEE